MSGIIHAIGKVFHTVTHVVGHWFHEAATHWQYVALAAAAVYTGGAALGYWGAGSGVAATTAGTVGTDVLTSNIAATTAATAAGTGTSLIGAGGIASAIPEVAAAGGTIGGAAAAAPFAALASNVATSGSAATGTQSFLGSLWTGAKAVGSDIVSGASKVAGGVSNFFGMGTTGAAGAAGGGMASWAKMQLLSTGLQMVGSYLASKPVPPNNYSGRGPNGGVGIGMHTINGGFGLAAGGSTPAPTGVPGSMIPPAGSATPPGANLSASASNQAGGAGTSTPGNIGQTVANSAGVGGLVPQGAQNFMGAPPTGA